MKARRSREGTWKTRGVAGERRKGVEETGTRQDKEDDHGKERSAVGLGQRGGG